MKNRGLGRVYQRKRTTAWWIQYYHRGKLYRESAGSSVRNDAVKLLRRRLAEMGDGRVFAADAEKVTFEDLVQLVLNDYHLQKRRSLDRVEHGLKHLRPFFGQDRAVEISSERIAEYIRQRETAGAKTATIVQELATLRRGFSLAVRVGKLDRRPYFPTIRLQNARTGFFELAEFQALLAALPVYLRPAVECMYLTGWRSRSEVLKLRWSQVDLEIGVVRLEVGTTKNGEGRTFPFSALPRLEALLRGQRESTTALERTQGRVIPWVFHRNGDPIRSFSTAWWYALRAAGITDRVPHDLRRTAVRNLVRAGVPETVAMKLTGHKTRDVFDRYDVTSGRDLREAVEKLAAYHQGNGATRRSVVPLG